MRRIVAIDGSFMLLFTYTLFKFMLRWLLSTIFSLAGWKAVGHVRRDIPKAMWIVAPHNTWKDFLLGLAARSVIKINIGFLGKAELFKPPFGWLFYALGGTPVNRSKRNNLVDSVADVFNNAKTLHVAITPEGTRKNVSELKSGFYFMAAKANVPLMLVGFDYPNKQVIFTEPFYVSGDFEQDKVKIAAFFSTIPGKRKDWINNYLAIPKS